MASGFTATLDNEFCWWSSLVFAENNSLKNKLVKQCSRPSRTQHSALSQIVHIFITVFLAFYRIYKQCLHYFHKEIFNLTTEDIMLA